MQDQAMGRRSKGDRVVTTVRLMLPVWEYCRAEADARGVPLGTYVADVMAVHANRADLVQELELFSIRHPRPATGATASECNDLAERRATARLMRPVWEYCRAEARARRVPIITYVADVMAAHAGRADLIRDLTDTEELLPLAL